MMTRKDYIRFADMFAHRLQVIQVDPFNSSDEKRGRVRELKRIERTTKSIFAEDNPAFNADRFDAFITKAATSA